MIERIRRIPRVDWRAHAPVAAARLTASLRTEYGTQTLRDIQGAALLAAYQAGGLYMQGRVGVGKTLVSGLLPLIWKAERPLILVPGKLVKKTRRDFEAARAHWRIPRNIRIESYSKIGRPEEHNVNLLRDYRPDVIVCDEAQALKHPESSACAGRVAQYIAANPTVKCAFMSGNMVDASILESAHMLVWALGDGAPVPIEPHLQELWAAVLDAKVPLRGDPMGLIPDLGPGCDSVQGAREAYRDRLFSCPGVVISTDVFSEVGLSIEEIRLEPPDESEQAWYDLRELWAAPDGWLMADARFEVWAVARQMALGFYYRHEPWPPEVWWKCRKAYAKFVRGVIENSDTYDSEKIVREDMLAGKLGEKAQEFARAWFETVKPTFKIKKVPTWLSTHALDAAERWGKDGGVIWCEHVAFAEELSRRTGWAFFQEQGLDAQGRFIEDVRDRTIIASVRACGEGFNLQYQWHRALLTSPPTTAREWEQTIGRIHRPGQKRDCLVHYFCGAWEHVTAVRDATSKSEFVEATTWQQLKPSQVGLHTPRVTGTHSAWSTTTKQAA